jgi:anti-anti-sigma factor
VFRHSSFVILNRHLIPILDKEHPSIPVFMPAQSKVVPLEGEIDLHISPRITTTLNAAVKAKPRNLVIDMGNVSYIDSSGLAVLIEAMQKVEKYGGKFALAGLQENVKPIFEIARLDQVFRIYPDIDSALSRE